MSELTTQITYSDAAILGLSLLGFTSYYTKGRFWNKPNPFEYKLYERPQLLGVSKASNPSETSESNNIASQLKQLAADGVIFWASQSGRAESFAYRLEKDLSQRFNIRSVVADLSDYDHDTFASIPSGKFAVFILSTYGEGDPPDNGWSFWNWLNMESDATPLKYLRFAAFGLGNSNYRYYNKVVDVVVDRMVDKGATMLLPIGNADDAKGQSEEDFLQWKDNFFDVFREIYNLEEKAAQYQPTIEVIEEIGLDSAVLQKIKTQPFARSDPKASPVAEVQISETKLVTTAQASKHCIHLELDLSKHPQLKYKTGDHLMLWPTNPEAEISRILKVLGRQNQRNHIISLSAVSPGRSQPSLPTPTTLGHLFEHYLEICAPVSREVVLALRMFTTSNEVKTVLSSVASTKEDYVTFVHRQHVTFARILEYTQQIDPSVSWDNVPLSFVLENLRSMNSRYYSISSSSSVSPRRAAITVSMSSTLLPTTPTITIPGLVSSYLSSLPEEIDTPLPTLSVQLRRSDFKLPSSSSTPLILIAAGSGIAPMRAFLQERARLASIGRENGRILLFYGCRHPDQDYLYRHEIEGLARGSLIGKLEIILAFSRYSHKKVYVQDRVAEYGKEVTKMLTEDMASLYICGSTTMARSAGDEIVEAVKRFAGFKGQTGDEWRSELKRFRRWQQDVWG